MKANTIECVSTFFFVNRFQNILFNGFMFLEPIVGKTWDIIDQMSSKCHRN